MTTTPTDPQDVLRERVEQLARGLTESTGARASVFTKENREGKIDDCTRAIMEAIEEHYQPNIAAARWEEREDDFAAGYALGVDAETIHSIDGPLYKRGKASR